MSLDGNALARDRKFGITTNPRNGEGDLTINWYEIFEYLIANQIIPNVRGGTFTDQNSKGTVMFVAIEANNHTRTQSILSEFWITNYRNESVIRPALVPSGSITATQNPCTIPTGQVLCTAKISFTSTNTKDAYVKVRQTGGIVTRGESGSFDAPWISTTPLNLDLYEGTKLLSSVEVKGTPQQVVVTKPTGSITASPNPCAIPSGQLLCASVITWTSSNTKDTVHVRIRETGAVFTRGASGTATAPWITGTPLHFDLYDGTELLGTAKVTGEVSKARFITANPNPCTLKADGLCSTSLSVNAPGYTNLQIKVREINTPLTGVAQTLPGPMVAPWIPAQGYTFDLYSNGTLIDSLQVKGIR